MFFGDINNRLTALEGKLVLPGAPAPQPAAPQPTLWTRALPWIAIAISVLALGLPFVLDSNVAERAGGEQRRAAIGPILNNVSLAEKKLWAAKTERSSIEGGTDADLNALKTKVSDLQSAYLDATYQVLPHGNLSELSSMNRLTQVVLASGFVPDEAESEVKISQAMTGQHAERVSDFQRTFKCAVNETDRTQCDK